MIVAYDRVLTTLCFQRNLEQLVQPERQSPKGISAKEVEYVASRMAMTFLYGLSESWVFQAETLNLIDLSPRKATQDQLEQCERVANNVLLFEGVVNRSGAPGAAMKYSHAKQVRTRIQIARVLYRKASFGRYLLPDDRALLKAMSNHSLEWVKYLSILPNNDFWDQLGGLQTELRYRLELP